MAAPAIKRDLNPRHLQALFYLDHRRGVCVAYLLLEAVIGPYAANTILSLEQRGLIAGDTLSGYEITPRGQELATEYRARFEL